MKRNPTANRGDRWRLFVASAGWLGLAPIAPGSFGALLGVAIHLVIWSLFASSLVRTVLVGSALLLVSWAHFAVTGWAIAYWRDKDPKNFVLDEVAGYLVVPLLHPQGSIVFVVVAGFLLFRVLDIIKLPPARQIDRDWVGAWGILLDDIVSGVYAVVVVYGLERILVQ